MDSKNQDFGFVYKCRLCGKLETNPRFYGHRYKAIKKLVEIETVGCCTDDRSITTTSLHTCKDGNLGISDLQGIIVITP